MKKIILILVASVSLWACPFDEAGVEVTILAHTEIYRAAKSGNFNKATKAIEKNKKLYRYFEQTGGGSIYQPLLNASSAGNKGRIKAILDRTLALEVKELLGQVSGHFSNYQKSRLKLIKAKKHLKALTRNRTAMGYMKKILKSLGNPGLMNVGKRPANKAMFSTNRSALLRHMGI